MRFLYQTVPQCLSFGACSHFGPAISARPKRKAKLLGAGYENTGANRPVAAPGQVITLFVKRLNVPDARGGQHSSSDNAVRSRSESDLPDTLVCVPSGPLPNPMLVDEFRFSLA